MNRGGWCSRLWFVVAAAVLAGTGGERPAQAEGLPIIVVFDLDNQGATLSPVIARRLADYLAVRLAATGAFRVVPRDQLKQRLTVTKTDSYKACYDQSCQIELGRELAAEKSVATTILKIGSNCEVSTSIFDLASVTSERAATEEVACTEDAVKEALKAIAHRLAEPARAVVTGPTGPAAGAPARTCPTGQEVSPDTAGHCCWPGQGWNGSACVGKPSRCPADWVTAAAACVLPECGVGQVRPDGVHCCWPRQAWSSGQRKCLGQADCPAGTVAVGEGCSADAALLAKRAAEAQQRRLGEAWERVKVTALDRRVKRAARVEGLTKFLADFPDNNRFEDEAMGLLDRIQKGAVRIESSPGKAAVQLDGRDVGRTPLALTLEPGDHQVRLALDGHFPVSRPVTLLAEEETTVRIELSSYPMNPYKKWGHGLFWSGLATAGFWGGTATAFWVAYAHDYSNGVRSARDKELLCRDLMISGWVLGGAMMVGGIVMWALSPGDAAWAKSHGLGAGAGPSPDGRGMALTVSGRW